MEYSINVNSDYHPTQQLVADHPARFKVVAAGRRWGKTRWCISEILETALAGGRAWWVAPSHKHAKEGWDPLVRLTRKALKGVADVRLVEKEIRFGNGGLIEVRTTSDPNQPLRGAGLDLVVMDEAAFVRESAWHEELRPALMDRGGKAIFISTPKGHNWFHDLYERAGSSPNWARFQFPTWDNPYIPKDDIEDAKAEMGSLLFSQEIAAEFLTAGGNVFKAEWFDKFYTATTDDDGVMWVLLPDGTRMDVREAVRYCTVDLAASLKESADYTVVGSFAAWKQWIVVLEMKRVRVEAPDILPLVQQQIDRWDLAAAYLERAGFQLSLIQEARRRGMPVKELRADRDKLARALPAAARMEAGNVVFPQDQPAWFDALRAEAILFPEAKHDDQVDVLAYGVRVAAGLKRARSDGVWPDDLGRVSPNKV
jgi:predicted phage terminase large subunit-like protein